MRRGAALAVLAGALALAAPAQAAGPPQIAASWATEVSASSAVLHAEVNPDGLPTTYRFEYLSEAAYQANLAAVPPREGFTAATKAPAGAEASLGSGAATLLASQHPEGLKAATTYRYRITATNSSSPPGGTPGPAHALTTEPAGLAFSLPDDRGWELVSPVDKNGGAIQGFGANSGGDVLQAAADGNSATYSSSASFGEGSEGAPVASQYISTRTPGGWSTENITGPTLSGAYGDNPDGVPYQFFSTDLARGLLLNSRRCGAGEACPHSYSLRLSAGGALTPSPAEPDLRFAGASPDLGHVVLSTCAALTPEATEVPSGGGGCDPSAPNLYEWSEGALALINLLPGEAHGTPGAHLAAQSGAISTDGSRVYFIELEDGFLYLREAGHSPKLVSEGGALQSASADGAFAFYTKAGQLFRYQAQTGTSEPLAEGMQGVLGASEDGSHLYYATGAGLFLWQAPGTTTEVASAPSGSFAGDYPPSTATARVTPDGSHLAFLSEASLTGFDNLDADSGQPDSELFLYSAPSGGGEGALTCASCNPTGARPQGPASIPGAIANGKLATATQAYKPRVLSTDGTRLFFDSTDSLAPQDTDNRPDVYEWEAQGSGTCAKPGGCLDLISSGKSAAGASFVDASADGRDAFFLTDGSLVPSDPGSFDLYDAREGGGFPVPPPPLECDGDTCQPLPFPPEDPAVGSAAPGGEGNPAVHFPKGHRQKPKNRHEHSHRKKHQRKHHRLGRGGRR